MSTPAPPAPPRPDDLLTVFEVADRLRVHERTVRKWEAEGTLAAVRVGRGVRFRRDVVDAFIDGRSGS